MNFHKRVKARQVKGPFKPRQEDKEKKCRSEVRKENATRAAWRFSIVEELLDAVPDDGALLPPPRGGMAGVGCAAKPDEDRWPHRRARPPSRLDLPRKRER